MMLDIFSSFDPNILSMNFFFFSVLMLLFLLILFSSYWLGMNLTLPNFSMMKSVISQQSERSLGSNLKGFILMVVFLFILIIMMNILGMMPYVFSFSSHLIFTLSFSLSLWLTLILSSVMNNPKMSVTILLPSGAPEWLNPFLILIETISISMRPITLGFRLAANMTAGHVVLGLMGSYISSSLFISLMSSSVALLIQIGYIMFEFGICLIQSYIFCLLITLYANDHS
uniref:ATP synthase subunit a n=1 Tax=Streptosyllis sp. THS1 TaxID=1898410 RepID=A0A1C9UZ91_9ANNE|nr:ATP synthase F0 subunit 8 [Streptosyllis sp. THS1]